MRERHLDTLIILLCVHALLMSFPRSLLSLLDPTGGVGSEDGRQRCAAQFAATNTSEIMKHNRGC